MTVVAAVVARLEALSAVTTLVNDRIEATHLDEDSEMPAVLVQLVGKIETIHLRGPDNIKRARVQVESVALTKDEADALAATIHGDGLGTAASGLNGFKGQIGSPSFVFECVRPAGEREHFDPPPNRQYRVQKDYLIDFQGD